MSTLREREGRERNIHTNDKYRQRQRGKEKLRPESQTNLWKTEVQSCLRTTTQLGRRTASCTMGEYVLRARMVLGRTDHVLPSWTLLWADAHLEATACVQGR
jgi:hypothetical protein